MAKPKSEEKRSAIMAAAARVIASQGLGAPTAVIAQEAGVANGTLFTYFQTKTDLLNELYLELKSEMVAAALAGLSAKADLRKQAFHIWKGSMGWGVKSPDKRRAFSQLCVWKRSHGDARRGTKGDGADCGCNRAHPCRQPDAERVHDIRRRDHQFTRRNHDGLHDPRTRRRRETLQGRV